MGMRDSKDKAIALAATGETAIEFMSFQQGMGADEEAACIKELGQIDSTEAKRQMRLYLRPDAPGSTLEALTEFLSPEEMADEGKINVLLIPSALKSIQDYTPDNYPYAPYIRDRDLSALSGLTGLQYLFLDNTQVSDVSALSGLTGLQSLSLDNTQVSDVSALSGLTGLQSLYLTDTQVSDVSALSGLTGLEYLFLTNTPVSEEEVKRFRQRRKVLGLREVNIVYSFKAMSESE